MQDINTTIDSTINLLLEEQHKHPRRWMVYEAAIDKIEVAISNVEIVNSLLTYTPMLLDEFKSMETTSC